MQSLVIASVRPTLEKPLRGDPRALGHCRELGPHHVFGDPAHTGRGVEAAIGAGHHPSRVTDGARDVFEAVGDDLGMLDKARQIVNDAGRDDLIVGEREFLQYAIFMLMPGIGEGKYKPVPRPRASTSSARRTRRRG